jgi:hypothetical protein
MFKNLPVNYEFSLSCAHSLCVPLVTINRLVFLSLLNPRRDTSPQQGHAARAPRYECDAVQSPVRQPEERTDAVSLHDCNPYPVGLADRSLIACIMYKRERAFK